MRGGRRLAGRITPSANKNAVLPILCATLLTDEPVTLRGVPDITDARKVLELFRTLGSDVGRTLLKSDYAATHAEKTAGTNYLVTVVGFRDTVRNSWRFYYQRRKMLIGVHGGAATRMVLQDRLVPIV